LKILTSSNPVDMGWWAVRTRPSVVDGSGNSWAGATGLAREVAVKVYGVAVTTPQG